MQITDGAVQTTGCTVRIKPIGVAEGDGAGTTAYSTDGIVLYTPTQAETNYTSFVLVAKKTGCIPVALTIVTTSSATPGTVLLAPVTHASAVVPTVTTLTGHTAQTGDSFARIGATGSGLTSLASQTSVNALGSASAITVERSVSDANSITFAWPVSGATITGTKSINNAIPYTAVSGTIAFLRTETGKHYYTLAHNAADRPSAEGQVRYAFVDGTYTRYVVLRTVTTVLADAAHGGAAATLVLSTIDIQPASADTPGVLIRGTGSAAGIDVKGGEYADGIKARSGDTSGYGICSNGVQGGARFWSTNGYGVRVSSDNSNAFSIYGGTYAFQINSVNNAIDVYSSTGNAVYLQSAQNDAVVIYPGADDIGVHIWGGQTSGDAVALSSNGTGSVFYPVDLSGLNDLSAADVNAEVVDVLSVDTFAELSAPPAATSSLKDKLTWLFMYARNKVTQTATTRTLYRDDTTTVAGTSGTSDNGTTFTKGEDA